MKARVHTSPSAICPELSIGVYLRCKQSVFEASDPFCGPVQYSELRYGGRGQKLGVASKNCARENLYCHLFGRPSGININIQGRQYGCGTYDYHISYHSVHLLQSGCKQSICNLRVNLQNNCQSYS